MKKYLLIFAAGSCFGLFGGLLCGIGGTLLVYPKTKVVKSASTPRTIYRCKVLAGPKVDGAQNLYLVERNGIEACLILCNVDGSFESWASKEYFENSPNNGNKVSDILEKMKPEMDKLKGKTISDFSR
jgi:tetrahydromethanopterin S-methyltransferase subunit D